MIHQRNILTILMLLILFLFSIGFKNVYSKELNSETFEKFAHDTLTYSFYWEDGFGFWGAKNRIFPFLHANKYKTIYFDVFKIHDAIDRYDLVFKDVGIDSFYLRISATSVNDKLFLLSVDDGGITDQNLSTGIQNMYKTLKVVIPDSSGIEMNSKITKEESDQLKQVLKRFVTDNYGKDREFKNKSLNFNVGPLMSKKDFDAYVPIYCEEKNKIYYWPILPKLLKASGERSFSLYTPLDNLFVDEQKEIVNKIMKNCVSDGTLIRVKIK